jgi:predicted SprT family Zn-dependent metalloprotease
VKEDKKKIRREHNRRLMTDFVDFVYNEGGSSDDMEFFKENAPTIGHSFKIVCANTIGLEQVVRYGEFKTISTKYSPRDTPEQQAKMNSYSYECNCGQVFSIKRRMHFHHLLKHLQLDSRKQKTSFHKPPYSLEERESMEEYKEGSRQDENIFRYHAKTIGHEFKITCETKIGEEKDLRFATFLTIATPDKDHNMNSYSYLCSCGKVFSFQSAMYFDFLLNHIKSKSSSTKILECHPHQAKSARKSVQQSDLAKSFALGVKRARDKSEAVDTAAIKIKKEELSKTLEVEEAYEIFSGAAAVGVAPAARSESAAADSINAIKVKKEKVVEDR